MADMHVPLGGFLSRSDRRRIKALAAAVGRCTDSDAAFFERFPDRRHRCRVASRAEVETDLILKGAGEMPLVSGAQWTAIVKQLAPGVRVRIITPSVGRGAADFDVTEDLARWAYEEMVAPGSYMHEREQQMRLALAKMGAPK